MMLIRLGSAVMLVLAVGCSKTASPPQQGPVPTPVAAAQPVATAGCWEILQCYKPCGTDAACLDACLQRGDATAQAQVNAVIDCATHCNNDTTCVAEQCRTQISTCQANTGAAAVPAAAAASRQPHPTEGLVSWMVGDWTASNHQFSFTSDGTVRRSLSAWGGNCASTVTASGPVTQDGDVLVMDLGEETARNCNTKVEGGPAKRVRYRIEWYEANEPMLGLKLRDLDCTQGDLYCVELMRRR